MIGRLRQRHGRAQKRARARELAREKGYEAAVPAAEGTLTSKLAIELGGRRGLLVYM